jgi:hypothetical protein
MLILRRPGAISLSIYFRKEGHSASARPDISGHFRTQTGHFRTRTGHLRTDELRGASFMSIKHAWCYQKPGLMNIKLALMSCTPGGMSGNLRTSPSFLKQFREGLLSIRENDLFNGPTRLNMNRTSQHGSSIFSPKEGATI